jgi:hypothetical protein
MFVMKNRQFLLVCALFTAAPLLATSVPAQTLVTFDDLNETGSGSYIAAPYQGLVWSNFAVGNAILFTNQPGRQYTTNGLSGDYYGMVSASNVAVNGIGNPAEIDSPGTNFNFLSAYLTGFWNSNLNIEVQGFRGGSLLYDVAVIASATNPTLFTFNYLNIDRLYFSNSGGQPAFGTPSAPQFVMDNFTFEFIPEPSSLLLTGLGAVTLWTLLKRKRSSA